MSKSRNLSELLAADIKSAATRQAEAP